MFLVSVKKRNKLSFAEFLNKHKISHTSILGETTEEKQKVSGWDTGNHWSWREENAKTGNTHLEGAEQGRKRSRRSKYCLAQKDSTGCVFDPVLHLQKHQAPNNFLQRCGRGSQQWGAPAPHFCQTFWALHGMASLSPRPRTLLPAPGAPAGEGDTGQQLLLCPEQWAGAGTDTASCTQSPAQHHCKLLCLDKEL